MGDGDEYIQMVDVHWISGVPPTANADRTPAPPRRPDTDGHQQHNTHGHLHNDATAR